jgi:hypothetical protein
MIRRALWVPLVMGLKRTLMVQLSYAGMVAPAHALDSAKSLTASHPVMATLVMRMAVGPRLTT